MQVYAGGDNHLSTAAWLSAVGFGQMKSPVCWQPPFKEVRWVLNNGAFSLYRAGTGQGRYDSTMGPAFRKLLARVEAGTLRAPDFAILPYIVAGKGSLALSLRWLERFPKAVPAYLAVQDGMSIRQICSILHKESGISGVFVGGSIPWKHATAGDWANLAHEFDLPCHVGRIGMPHDIFHMIAAGIDSIDSTSWARHRSYDYIRQAFELWAKATGEILPALRTMRRVPLPI